MDSVIHTLVIILFVLIPGFIFRRVYFQGGFSKQFDSKSWSHSLFYSILFGLLIDALAIFFYTEFYKSIDGKSIIEFYRDISKHQIPNWVFSLSVLKCLLVFFVILLLTSFLLGYIIYGLVRVLKLDRRFKSLRFNNHWHYYFTGEIKDFKEYKHIKGDFICSHVDALVNTENGKNILYSGFLSSHSICNDTGGLEAIYITFPQRYDLEKSVWKDIKSDVLIIPNRQIINLNIRYTFKESEPVPYEALLFIATTIFIWIDWYNLLIDYTFLSKIYLKIHITLISVFIFATVTFYRDIKKSKNIKESIEKKTQLKYNIISILLFSSILALIFYLNR